eukprot:scaffold62019_cov19-Tisochrysis_lutea.AAC.1
MQGSSHSMRSLLIEQSGSVDALPDMQLKRVTATIEFLRNEGSALTLLRGTKAKCYLRNPCRVCLMRPRAPSEGLESAWCEPPPPNLQRI